VQDKAQTTVASAPPHRIAASPSFLAQLASNLTLNILQQMVFCFWHVPALMHPRVSVSSDTFTLASAKTAEVGMSMLQQVGPAFADTMGQFRLLSTPAEAA